MSTDFEMSNNNNQDKMPEPLQEQIREDAPEFHNNNQAFIDNMEQESSKNINTDVLTPFKNIIDESIPLTLEEKKQLRVDLLNLPPEKLGDVMTVLKRNLPNEIEQTSDELVLDLKTLDTKILRHLQRYVHAIYLQLKQSLYGTMPLFNQFQFPQMIPVQQQIYDPSKIDPNSFNDPNNKRKRSSFNEFQKSQMIDFWSKLDWEPCNDELQLHQFASIIGVSIQQLKIFRQNNRKRKLIK